jgi:phage terminase small subunit
MKAAFSGKRLIFIKEYLIDKNATRAAQAAGYSSKTAYSAGHRLLKNVEIAVAIEEGVRRQVNRAELKAADVIFELRNIAFTDLSLAFDEVGKIRHPTNMPEDIRKALQSFETVKSKNGETVKIKLHDKLRALEMLAKHFKLLTDVQEVTGKDGGCLVVLHLPANGSEASGTNFHLEKNETEQS